MSTKLVQAGPEGFRLGESPVALRNRLTDHPLFEPERIKRLLRSLPRNRIEIRAVRTIETRAASHERQALLTERDPVDTFERLEEEPAWMLLHRTWLHDPEYAELMRQYMDDLRSNCSDLDDDVLVTGCWMFLSSGKSAVHFHSDPDQSVLNQVRGTKTIFVYPQRILPPIDVENLVYTENQKSVTYRDEYENQNYESISFGPGDSVYLPLYAPHRVDNDDDLCIAWNVGFHTRQSRRTDNIHFVNGELRRLGLSPAPIGERAWGDALKSRSRLAARASRRVRKVLRRQA